MAQPFGRGIHRQHLAGGQRLGLAVRVGQDHELARRHLPAVVEPDRPRDQQRLAHGDGAVEKGLPRPHAFEHAAVVPQDGMEDPEAAAGRQHALGHHPSDAGHLLADLGANQRGDGGGVDVAVGEMPEEVARGADAEPLEQLGSPLADAFQKLDAGVETERAGGRGGSRGARCWHVGPSRVGSPRRSAGEASILTV